MKHFLRFALLMAALLSLSLPAQASSGVIAGQVTFTNQNGGFCPSTQPCTGATYTEAQYGQTTGLPEALVGVFSSGGILLNMTQTDASGFYALDWSWGSGSSNLSGFLAIYFYNGSNRFRLMGIRSSYASNAFLGGSAAITLQHGTTINNPEILTPGFGSNPVADAYWAGWKLWESLETSNRQLTWNTDVEVFAFDTGGIASCGTSCARPTFRLAPRPAWAGARMTVVLDGAPATPYDPQGRMMHELGHIADFISAPSQQRMAANGDNFGGVAGHDIDTQEFTTSSMAEGFAHFFAAAALYTQSATDPRWCGANGNGPVGARHCWGATAYKPRSIENVGGACAAGTGRHELNALRYFWDLYDARVDDNILANVFHLSDALATASCPNFPACYGAGQLHDSWTFVASPVDWFNVTVNTAERDNNGTSWYRGLFDAAYSVNTSAIATQNCLSFL